jgi:hypothetical protein
LDGTILVKSGVVALFCDESSDDEFSSLIFSSELTLFSYDDTIEYYYKISQSDATARLYIPGQYTKVTRFNTTGSKGFYPIPVPGKNKII